jgi:hypothetical protein
MEGEPVCFVEAGYQLDTTKNISKDENGDPLHHAACGVLIIGIDRKSEYGTI